MTFKNPAKPLVFSRRITLARIQRFWSALKVLFLHVSRLNPYNVAMEELIFGWEKVRIEMIERPAEHLGVLLRPTIVSADCPLCEQSSHRVQSRYQRSLQDLPCCGQVLRLRVTVRRFFRNNAACRRKVFAEQLPELMRPYARRTVRQNEALTTVGLRTVVRRDNELPNNWDFG
jgi:hypothetical protein